MRPTWPSLRILAFTPSSRHSDMRQVTQSIDGRGTIVAISFQTIRAGSFLLPRRSGLLLALAFSVSLRRFRSFN
jgi:hypothetical protein